MTNPFDSEGAKAPPKPYTASEGRREIRSFVLRQGRFTPPPRIRQGPEAERQRQGQEAVQRCATDMGLPEQRGGAVVGAEIGQARPGPALPAGC